MGQVGAAGRGRGQSEDDAYRNNQRRSECESKLLYIMLRNRVGVGGGGLQGKSDRAAARGVVECQTVRIENQVLFSFLLEVQRCPKMKSS